MFTSFRKKYFSGLTKGSVLLAFTSLFADISTEMLYPVLPIYLTQNLKANGSILGIIEGIATATQNIIQGFSGWLSDKMQRRKPVALLGYLLSALSKPFIGISTTWPGVLGARFTDRLGAGIRSAPRDALIASSVSAEHKGKAFGLEGIGDNLGAFIGPLITVLLFFTLHTNIRYIFYLAIIPGLLAFLLMLLIKEKKFQSEASKTTITFRHFPKAYWNYLIAAGIFGLSNLSNSFLILQVRESGMSLVQTILVYAIYNLMAAVISYPAGAISDHLGRKPVLLSGYIIFFLTFVGFAIINNSWGLASLFIFYGFFQGIFRAVGKSVAADFVPAQARASSIGWYSTVIGLSALFASIVAGLLWDKVSHLAVFIYGAAVSLCGIVSLWLLVPVGIRQAGR